MKTLFVCINNRIGSEYASCATESCRDTIYRRGYPCVPLFLLPHAQYQLATFCVGEDGFVLAQFGFAGDERGAVVHVGPDGVAGEELSPEL